MWLGTSASKYYKYKWSYKRKSNKYAGLASWKRSTSPASKFFGFKWPSSPKVLILDS